MFVLGSSTLSLLILFLLPVLVHSESQRKPVAQANYKQAFHYSNAFLQQFVYDMAVTPNWIGKTDSFWYAFRTSTGTHYWRVDPAKPEKVSLFDQVKLATLLSETTQK